MSLITIICYTINSGNINPDFTLSDFKDIATILGVIIAGTTLIRGLLEYSYQGRQKRAEHFFNLRKKLKENAIYKNICYLLEIDSTELKQVPFADKRDFLGLFEEIAIMKQSKLVKPNVTFYMFGYYAIRCWDSQNFWVSVNKDSLYWRVFKEFVEEAKQFEKNHAAFTGNEIKI